MKEYAQKTKQLSRTIQGSGKNQKVGFVDNRENKRNEPIQMAGGKKHHPPSRKKYLAKGVGKEQEEVTKRQHDIMEKSGTEISYQEAKRKAKGSLKKEEKKKK